MFSDPYTECKAVHQSPESEKSGSNNHAYYNLLDTLPTDSIAGAITEDQKRWIVDPGIPCGLSRGLRRFYYEA